MRTIKFRMYKQPEIENGEIIEQGEMIDGDSLAFEEYAPLVDLLNQEGIMQYTGLHDRNGAEIYEGDIVNDDKWGKCEVVFLNASFTIKAHQHFVIGQERATKMKVLGNIYQHQELLD